MTDVKRAILYCRVSTENQADKGYSLPTQLEACRNYAERLGFEVVAEFAEDYSGATPLEQRPEGKKAHRMLTQDQADVLIGYTIDRLVRPPEEGDEILFLTLIHSLNKTGKQIHATDTGQLKMDFVSLMTAMLKASAAGDERRKIRERTIRGRRAKARSGKVVGGSRPPYGYRFVRDHNNKVVGLEIGDYEADVVRRIFRWYADGEPMLAVARKLEAEGVSTPGDDGYKNRGIHSSRGVWGWSQVQEIIENETYAGIWHYGKRSVRIEGAGKPLYRDAPEDQHIAVNVPAIIDSETWQAALKRRKYNKLMSKRNGKIDYLLRGLMQCSCGGQMTGALTGCGLRRYRCTRRYYVESDCHEPSITAEAMEAQIWEDLRGLFHDLNRLKRELKIAQQEELDQQEPKRAELEAVEENIRHTDREAAEIAETLPGAKGRVKELMEARMAKVNEQYTRLMKRRSALQSELATRRLTNGAIGDVSDFCP